MSWMFLEWMVNLAEAKATVFSSLALSLSLSRMHSVCVWARRDKPKACKMQPNLSMEVQLNLRQSVAIHGHGKNLNLRRGIKQQLRVLLLSPAQHFLGMRKKGRPKQRAKTRGGSQLQCRRILQTQGQPTSCAHHDNTYPNHQSSRWCQPCLAVNQQSGGFAQLAAPQAHRRGESAPEPPEAPRSMQGEQEPSRELRMFHDYGCSHRQQPDSPSLKLWY